MSSITIDEKDIRYLEQDLGMAVRRVTDVLNRLYKLSNSLYGDPLYDNPYIKGEIDSIIISLRDGVLWTLYEDVHRKYVLRWKVDCATQVAISKPLDGLSEDA